MVNVEPSETSRIFWPERCAQYPFVLLHSPRCAPSPALRLPTNFGLRMILGSSRDWVVTEILTNQKFPGFACWRAKPILKALRARLQFTWISFVVIAVCQIQNVKIVECGA